MKIIGTELQIIRSANTTVPKFKDVKINSGDPLKAV